MIYSMECNYDVFSEQYWWFHEDPLISVYTDIFDNFQSTSCEYFYELNGFSR